MAYSDYFKNADDFIIHLDTSIGAITDPFIRSRYVGFIAVSAVTVYELAIKEIFHSFGLKKHKILGNFVHKYFESLNGQISRDRIEKKYLPFFGEKYVTKFRGKLDELELEELRVNGVSVKSSYGNLITWRNTFAHEGNIPGSATYEEVKKSYKYGCKLVDCLADTMSR